MNKRKTPRQLLLYFLGNKCVACNSSDRLKIDHKIALVNGGEDKINNLQALCESCHMAKTRKDLMGKFGDYEEIEPSNKRKMKSFRLSLETINKMKKIKDHHEFPSNTFAVEYCINQLHNLFKTNPPKFFGIMGIKTNKSFLNEVKE